MKRRPAPSQPAIDVIAFDPVGASTAGAPRAVDGRSVPLWCAAATVAATLVTALAMLMWWQHRTQQVLSVSRTPAVRAADIDASGCPVQLRCESRDEPTVELSTAIARIFPTADVLQTGSLLTTDDKVVRTSALLRTTDAVFVTATAQCEPAGAAVPRRRGPLTPAGPADGLLVVPGAAGCSVAVTAHTPAAVSVPVRELTELAEDPSIQLHP